MSVILFCLAIYVHLILEHGRQRYFRRCQIGKKTCTMYNSIGHQRIALPGPYMDRGGGVN